VVNTGGIAEYSHPQVVKANKGTPSPGTKFSASGSGFQLGQADVLPVTAEFDELPKLFAPSIGIPNRLDHKRGRGKVHGGDGYVSKTENPEPERFIKFVIADAVKLDLFGFAIENAIRHFDPLRGNLVKAGPGTNPFVKKDQQSKDHDYAEANKHVAGSILPKEKE
jgi:hypothetical protein